MRLHDSPFSPFARKVWMVLRLDEWLLSRGFEAWFWGELAPGRVGWPRR